MSLMFFLVANEVNEDWIGVFKNTTMICGSNMDFRLANPLLIGSDLANAPR